MEGYRSNSQCILDYLALFQALSKPDMDGARCRRQWQAILTREGASKLRLAPPLLRRQFQLGERDFLLAMAALALELDGGLRNSFRQTYALTLPTIEYGLQLISPICPSGCETLAKLAGTGALHSLLLTPAEPTAYPLERPLILCRTALAFLTGLSMADIPGCTLLTEDGEQWMPLYENELAQVQEWYSHGAENVLYLCAPEGSGRKTLLRRACGSVICAKLTELSDRPLPDQDGALREMTALAILLDAPICAALDSKRSIFRLLEPLCRRYDVPLAALVEEDHGLEGAKEVVRLPRQLPPRQRREAWEAFAPPVGAGRGAKGRHDRRGRAGDRPSGPEAGRRPGTAVRHGGGHPPGHAPAGRCAGIRRAAPERCDAGRHGTV